MIEVRNLKKVYKISKHQEVVALDDISFSIDKGETLNIIGKSGSGKTTLANILLGITKLSSGEFNVNDIEVDSKSKRKKLRLITNSLLSSFQYPTHQLFTKSVREEILFNCEDVQEEKLDEIIDIFSFPKELLSKSPFKLSSGQKRKVILMSLIMQNPDILIFDEATAFLDATSRREFVELTSKINREFGTTMIFISHNLKDALAFSNRTLLLDEGKVINDGNTNEVIKQYIGGDEAWNKQMVSQGTEI